VSETPDHTLAGPDAVPGGDTPPTEVEESDPNADSRDGLAGEMGVSSERKGPVRGVDEEVTYGVANTHPAEDGPAGDVPPEQSAYDGQPEVNPAGLGSHESDPDSNPGHGV
jgi:hypothetical protein